MKRVCAWCGKDMGEKEPLDDDSVTHAICKDCRREEFRGEKSNRDIERLRGYVKKRPFIRKIRKNEREHFLEMCDYVWSFIMFWITLNPNCSGFQERNGSQ